MKEINTFIDRVAAKFGYSEMLTRELKRIVPLMLAEADYEKRQMLLDTLLSVKIFVLPEDATKQDLEVYKEQVFGKDNHGVTFVSTDFGEYSRVKFAPGAYVTEPIFDENMNIVGRNRMLYVKELSQRDNMRSVYGSSINLRDLIHELGHAWAAEKDEYIQNADGTFVQRIGAAAITNVINRQTKEVVETSVEGIHIEEALNTIQEERVLLSLTGANSIDELRNKGFVGSAYQGLQKTVMHEYVKKFGSKIFEEYRYGKDKATLSELEKSLAATAAWTRLNTTEYTQAKRNKIATVDGLEVPEKALGLIKNFFQEYDEVYFGDNTRYTPIQKLDNVLEQLYNFNRIKYHFNILGSDKNAEIYRTVITSMVAEANAIRIQAEAVSRCEAETRGVLLDLKSKVQDEHAVREYDAKSAESLSVEAKAAPTKEDI